MRMPTAGFYGLFVFNTMHICRGIVYNVSLEKELHRQLFHDYNAYVLPRYNKTSPIPVAISVFFMFLDAVDIKSQTFTVRMFFRVSWIDSFLTWQPDVYSGVERLTVSINKIWTPNFYIHGSDGKLTDYGQERTFPYIYSNGMVQLCPSKVHKIWCEVNIKKYPFDEQNCSIHISSWTNDDTQVKISAGMKQIDLSMYNPNGEWRIEVGDAYSYIVPHGDTEYTHVVFPFTIHRKYQFVILHVFFPTVCTSLLTLLCFVLPTESGERVGLSISIFLTLSVFMIIASEDLPRTADGVSLLGLYTALQLVWSGLTIVLTTVSLAVAYKKDTDVPKWIHFLKKRRCGNVLTWKKQKVQPKEGEKRPCSENIPNDNVVLQTNGNGEQDVSWEYIATVLNKVCFYFSLLWQCALHLWFVIQSQS